MRRLFLLRGIPASGKSTWVKENGLSPYTVSADDVRLLYSTPIYDVDGKLNISQSENSKVWQLVNEIVQDRMSRGELVILDATNINAADARTYKGIAQDNRYIVYVVDFTDVPKEICLERNAKRESLRRVPDSVIERMSAALPHQKLPNSYRVVSPEQALLLINECEPFDLSSYHAVNVFGDVHGCYTALMNMLDKLGCQDGELRDDEFYIFCGDYIDRGIENAETLEYLLSIVDRENVMMLEGNHERWLDDWSHGRDAKSRTFTSKTAPQLDQAGIDRKSVARFYRRLIPSAWVRTANDELVVACHGGIPTFPKPYMGLSCVQLIKGVGDYQDVDEVNACWEATSGIDGIYQVHGHRVGRDSSIRPYEHVFSLEGAVERGGQLRVARFEKDKAPRGIFVENDVFAHVSLDVELSEVSFEDAVANLRANPMIKEKSLGDEIYSYNFTRDAFLKRAWDVQSIKARGLFLDLNEGAILARSYDKFFNIGEREETEIDKIASSFTYPIDVFEKENGYLGIASSAEDGKLFFASKTTSKGDYASEFKRLAIKTLGGNLHKFADYLEDINATAVFEVISPSFDRHIIEYNEEHIVLLDVIYNDFEFEHVPYNELCEVARAFKLDVKKLDCVIETKSQLVEWYENVSSIGFIPQDGIQIEGYVLVDSNDNMVKVKCEWYRYWKAIRGMIHDVVRRNRSSRVSELATDHPEVEEFYAWLKDYVREWRKLRSEERDPAVIDVRNAWFSHISE